MPSEVCLLGQPCHPLFQIDGEIVHKLIWITDDRQVGRDTRNPGRQRTNRDRDDDGIPPLLLVKYALDGVADRIDQFGLKLLRLMAGNKLRLAGVWA